MIRKMNRLRVSLALLSCTALALPLGCDDPVTSPETVDQPDGDAGGGGDGGGGGTKPLFALGAETFTDTSITSYVTFLDSLDAQPDVTLAQAREFPGYAPVSTSGGKVFVNSGEAPTIGRYVIGDDKAWTDDGTVSFSGFTSQPVSHSIQFSDVLAFAPADPATYVRWNPSTFELGAVAAIPPELVPATQGDGFALNRGYAYWTYQNLAYQTFYYATPQFQFHEKSYVALLDANANQWTSAFEVGCPHLHVGSADDQGGVFFSPGQFSVVVAELLPTSPRNCFIHVKGGESAADGAPIFFKDLAEGREGSNFFHVGGDIGFFNVYHRERATPEELGSAQGISYSSNYHLWTVDLKTRAAKMMEGIDFGGGQYTSFRFDGRVFVAMPAADYSSTTVYEIGADGRAERRFTAQAWVYNIVKVR